MTINKKEYLGDGLYADYDGYQYVLTAENGVRATDTVYLDPYVIETFLKYVTKQKGAKAA